jgi:hypothetical protein
MKRPAFVIAARDDHTTLLASFFRDFLHCPQERLCLSCILKRGLGRVREIQKETFGVGDRVVRVVPCTQQLPAIVHSSANVEHEKQARNVAEKHMPAMSPGLVWRKHADPCDLGRRNADDQIYVGRKGHFAP